jgi:UV DNA damage endonuclease
MRVDAHPDQFNVINSDRESVVENTIKTLDMQVDLFEAMDNEEGKLVIHIGGAKGGKEVAINRFIENLGKFPSRIKERLILENDDKIFSAKDVLYISKITKLPMVLDVHHHNCKNEGENISEFIGDVFDTWNQENIVPKIHFSTPREFINDRKHADYIDAKDFFDFIMLAKDYSNRDFDVMIEAKKKDIALFKLIDDLKIFDKNIKFIDKTTIEI